MNLVPNLPAETLPRVNINRKIKSFKKWYFVTIIVLTYCEKKLF